MVLLGLGLGLGMVGGGQGGLVMKVGRSAVN